MMKIIKVANPPEGIVSEQQQECMNAYALAGNILLVPKRHSAARDIDKIAMGLGAVKGRVWQRKVEDEYKHYLKTGIDGGYETAGIVDTELENKLVPLFEDTELIEQPDSICLDRHMIVGGKKFAVRSVFPKTSAKTPTDKLLSLIDKEQEAEMNSIKTKFQEEKSL